MKNTPVRILIVLAIVTLIGIISTQIYWLNEAIKQQDQVFNHNVNVALRNVVESLCEASGKDYPNKNPIEQVSGNYFIVRTNDMINIKNLEYLITAEIRERAITQDFEYGVYDCQNDKMVFSDNVNLTSHEPNPKLPILENEEYYFGVYFPEKSRNIIGGMDLWKFTTALTIIVVIFFGYGLFVILKQKRLSEVQRDFVNNVTHELKTPLATLTLASNTLLEKTSANNRKYVDIIRHETNRLTEQVEKILRSALTEEKSQIEKKEVDLGDFFKNLEKTCHEQYASRMISWLFSIDQHLKTKTDINVLSIALTNLIENAVKYGGTEVGISAFYEHQLVILISDNGQGIAKSDQKKIFEKFYRVPEEQNQHNVKGFGLGLHIVKSSIKKLGGKISVGSELGTGSVFTIELP
jgi:two-component system, OmpR family, phosphate regulon sensor histidine kinase PhoR